MADKKIIRIGCASGFWGDSATAALQFMRADIDYVVFDYLAEITMSLLARARARSPEAGYAVDFIETVGLIIGEVAKRRIKLVSNAGGVNPRACADAVRETARQAGVHVKVAAVLGDDLMERKTEFAAEREMFSDAPMPAALASMNAYLGATPIAEAFSDGAQIVITGRCVDSAVVLGPLMHEFGWKSDQHDLLAAGSLAGHLVECGPQVAGGVFTDWESVPDWDNMGYPIAECHADGRFVIAKPKGTGGLVTPATVAEQMVYEIGDPAAYLLPDVTCDFSQATLRPVGPDRVEVTGVRGLPPTDRYKVSATYADGYRVIATLTIIGFDAPKKARRTGEAIITRVRRMYGERGWPDFTETNIEVLGAEDSYGRHARHTEAREVVLKIGVRHPNKDALELFSREIAPSAISMAQGTTGFFGGRTSVSPVIRLFSFLVHKDDLSPSIIAESGERPCFGAASGGFVPPAAAHPAAAKPPSGDTVKVRLLELAHARSGDKGDIANIGVIARAPEFWPVVQQTVTPQLVADYFAHFLRGPVERFELPGIHALNFLLHRSLGGGGIASLRIDPQGKAYGQMLLDVEVPVAAAFARRHRLGEYKRG